MNRIMLSHISLALLLLCAPSMGHTQGERGVEEKSADASTIEAAKSLAEAREALRAAGFDEEAESVEYLLRKVNRRHDGGDTNPWRTHRAEDSEEGRAGQKDRVPSEISRIFREMFEIGRGVEEHEDRARDLRRQEAEIARSRDPEVTRTEFIRAQSRLREERQQALSRLRQRSPALRESIDVAVRKLDEHRSEESPSRRLQFMRGRLLEFRTALESAEHDDGRFYAALTEFLQKSKPPEAPHTSREGNPQADRVARVEREMGLLQDRLRELESEHRRLRMAPPPPPTMARPPGGGPHQGPPGPAPHPPHRN